MRLLAFALLLASAFDWPVPWLDRLGVAAAGFACLAFAISSAVPRPRRARPFPLPAKTIALSEPGDRPAAGLAKRIGGYVDQVAGS